MTLPEIVLPKIVLPFDIPVLLHPFVVHFLVAIPVIVLLLELMNLVMKKKAVGGVSFFLLLLTVFAAAGAYLTGLTDGQDAAFTEAAKTALGEHKLLGTYLLLASALVLVLKILAMTGSKVLKALYILVLIAFVVFMFKQGKEGGELVYKHGLNVQAVKTLDDKVFDLEEALEEAKTKTPVVEEVKAVEVQNQPSVTSDVTPVVETQTPEVIQTPQVQDTQVESVATQSPMETTGVETVSAPVQVTDEVVVIPSAEELPTPQ